MSTDWDNEIRRALDNAIEFSKGVIRKDGPKSTPYCIYSEKTGRKFGCYPSKKAAEERLRQIEFFKHDKKE